MDGSDHFEKGQGAMRHPARAGHAGSAPHRQSRAPPRAACEKSMRFLDRVVVLACAVFRNPPIAHEAEIDVL